MARTWLGRPSPVVGRDRAVSLFFAVGLRNLGVAVAVATILRVEGAVVIVVAFYVIQQLVAEVVAEGIHVRSPVGRERRRRGAASSASTGATERNNGRDAGVYA